MSDSDETYEIGNKDCSESEWCRGAYHCRRRELLKESFEDMRELLRHRSRQANKEGTDIRLGRLEVLTSARDRILSIQRRNQAYLNEIEVLKKEVCQLMTAVEPSESTESAASDESNESSEFSESSEEN